MTINNQIPAPTLYLKEGEDVTINVKNLMDEKTSLHWHGILLDGKMDGEYKEYYKNGQLCEICNYNNGKRIGEYKKYHIDGQIEIICNHIDDKLNE